MRNQHVSFHKLFHTDFLNLLFIGDPAIFKIDGDFLAAIRNVPLYIHKYITRNSDDSFIGTVFQERLIGFEGYRFAGNDGDADTPHGKFTQASTREFSNRIRGTRSEFRAGEMGFRSTAGSFCEAPATRFSQTHQQHGHEQGKIPVTLLLDLKSSLTQKRSQFNGAVAVEMVVYHIVPAPQKFEGRYEDHRHAAGPEQPIPGDEARGAAGRCSSTSEAIMGQGAFMVVEVPAGPQTLVFQYRPRWLNGCLLAGSAALLVSILCVLTSVVKRGRG